ncbi:MAG: TrpR-like protein YerC/YecD [Clostridia bacterium]|nr:TrpR-like protein YerC/YecD [Clostridia bacterium]
MKRIDKKDLELFYKAILSLETIEECDAFFNDVCTIQELEAFKQRLEVAVLLKEGTSYSTINKITSASTATISRVSKYLNYGDGGYSIVIDRIKGEQDV